MNKLKMLLFFITCKVSLINGARILGVMPIPSYSHQVTFQPLWRELSLRGHQVTVLTTNPVKDPKLTNLTEIDLSFSYKTWNVGVEEVIKNQDSFYKMMYAAITFMNEVVDKQLSHPEVQKLIKNKNEHFDLLIVEFLIHTMTAFSERFKCPYIGVTSLDTPAAFYGFLGNPSHPLLNPDYTLGFVGKLTFMERLASTILFTMESQLSVFNVNGMDATIKKHFGNDYPHLSNIQKNISMLFVNTNPVFHPVRPLLPTVIQIGHGIHRKPPQALPKDLQKHLDDATQGFIYFSLGSNVKSSGLKEKTRNVILETFAELPYKVLWKFEIEDLPGKPDNVIVSKWFSQQDVFKHPNIKLFITQGGIQSIEEAIYDHIPMVGIPFFMDQHTNIKLMVHNGLGLSLDYKTLDKESFKETILEVINNPKYRNRVKEFANLFDDQPMSGLEKAVWWTEYVIRHKGTKHLRSPVLDIPAYQYYLLDVIGLCLLVVFVFLYVTTKFVKLLFKLLKRALGHTKIKTQ